ncbi:multidrug effflux MFS transporter [Desulfosporosinus youngiae]|uniref:Bcr/CflA family efflux transporter n=1 Tax=Desulfosporosinus youngiae DSM 17734 TaxID=768710 RepID=H5XX50_9FIRM|nr:multidrug effflux MFS transporter [Desulfosporosinus youngiae]EHQ90990.1 drug resistance transporter, Bcr/CflA subfamily [Desulfosporosinus youngiae DSM 17734]
MSFSNSNQGILTGKELSDSKKLRYWTAFVLGSLAAIGPLSIDMYLPSLPSLTTDLQTSASLAQLSITACLLGMSLGQLLMGSLSDIRGRRLPLLIGLIAFTAASLLCAVNTSIGGLIALRFIQGVAGSAGIVISKAMVRDLYSGAEMMKFLSLLMLVNGLGPIMAPIIGGQLLEFTSWRGVFVALSLSGLVMFLAVIFGLNETLPVKGRTAGGLANTLTTYRKLISDRDFIMYALPQGFVTAAMFAYISGSPFVIQTIFGASPQTFSLIFAMNGLGIILAGQITGRLAPKIKGVKLYVGGLILAAVSGFALLLAILFKASLPVVLIPLFFVVSCVGAVGTAGSALAMENYGHAAGSASALLGLLSLIFGAFVAPLVGIGGSNNAVPMGIIIAICDVGALLIFILLRRPKGKG